MTQIAALIKASLTAAGKTQAGLADHLGVSQPTVSRWIRGASIPRRKHWVAAEEYLELAPHSIAHAAGVLVNADNDDAIPPYLLRAAHDLGELAEDDRKAVLDLINRLLR